MFRRHRDGSLEGAAASSSARRRPSMPLLAFLTAAALLASGLVTVVFLNAAAVTSPCQFQEARQHLNVAFCGTFSAPAWYR